MSDQFSMFSNFTPVKPGSWPVKGIGATNQPLQERRHTNPIKS